MSLEERNPNHFFEYFLKSSDTGTTYGPVKQSDMDKLWIPEFINTAGRWQSNYLQLMEIWKYLKKPSFFRFMDGDWEPIKEQVYIDGVSASIRQYKVILPPGGDTPRFQHNHGFRLLPWQLEMYRAEQPTIVCIGGFGSGKTRGAIAIELFNMAVYSEYIGFGIAPRSRQATFLQGTMKSLTRGTLYEKRFLKYAGNRGFSVKPYLKTIVSHSDIGESVFECYPLLDDDEKLLTLEADSAVIDQSERFPDLEAVQRNVGSRMRGFVRGRERMGKMTFIANVSDSNYQIWDLFDTQDSEPDGTKGFQPSSADNMYLGVQAMLRYQRDISKDEESRQMYIFGARPMGSGEHFSAEALNKCRSESLEEMLQKGIKDGTPGYVRETAHGASVVKWRIPPEPGGTYIVAADPGWDNPPHRNSAVVGVWRIDGFPHVPASLVSFDWVYGNKSPDPWLASFANSVYEYQAIGNCAFDDTGFQSGYIHMVHGLSDLLPQGVNMGGVKKLRYLNFARTMMNRGQLQIGKIPMLYNQLASYKYPEKDNMRQDIVSMILVSAAFLEQFWYETDREETKEKYKFRPRNSVNARSIRPRHTGRTR